MRVQEAHTSDGKEGAGELILKEMKALSESSWNYVVSATGNKNVNFHPEYLKCAMDNVLEKTGVTCFFHTRITGVCTEERAVTALECVDDEGCFLVEAKAFVDTTGDANVVHLAGAPTLWGDENGNVQAATLPFRLSGVDTSCDLTPQAVEKAVILSERSELDIKDFFPDAGNSRVVRGNTGMLKGQVMTLDEMEKEMIKEALRRNDGNMSMVSQQLGITRQTLYNKLKKYGL